MNRKRTLAAGLLALTLALSACGGHNSHDEDVAQSGGTGGTEHAGMDHSGSAGMDHSAMAAADGGDGLSTEVQGYELAAVKAPKTAGKAAELTFRINGPNGKAHKEYVKELGELMHVYVVREDLTQYQHLHPELDAKSGEWSIRLTVAEPGPYRVVTEFEALKPDGNLDARKLGDEFTVKGGKYEPAPWKPTFGSTAVDGYQLALEGEPAVGGEDLKLKITREDEDVTALQPYLESFAHITGFREGDLKAVHVHPSEEPEGPEATGGPELTLAQVFHEPGEYRLFVQFQTDNQVRVAPLDVQVT